MQSSHHLTQSQSRRASLLAAALTAILTTTLLFARAENAEAPRNSIRMQIDLDRFLLDAKNATLSGGATAKDGEDAIRKNPAVGDFPQKRFSLWSELTPAERTFAASLLRYTEETWGTPWRNAVEAFRHRDLTFQMKKALTFLEISQTQWDCHVNHYYGYKWDDLLKAEVLDYFVMLGWNQESWDYQNVTLPDVDGMMWDDLSESQKEVANQICYFKEVWDELPLAVWLVERRKEDWMRRASNFKTAMQ